MANPYFNAEYYLSQNPDVFAAGINTAEGAWEHYVNFGAAEALNGATSRKPAPWFDVNYYVAQNPDLTIAGLKVGQLFDHFTNFGLEEGRAPSAGANVNETTLSAYAAQNEDLQEALGIEDPSDLSDAELLALAQHFYAFGYNEERPGKPSNPSDDDATPGSTFTLTPGVDYADVAGSYRNGSTTESAFKFTSGNEVVNATTATLNNGDTSATGWVGDTLLDSSTTDNDVLKVAMSGATALGTLGNIETIDITTTAAAGGTAVTWTSITGLKTLNISGAATGNINLTNSATNIGNTGVTTIDASGLTSLNGGITVDSSTSTATTGLTVTGGNGRDVVVGTGAADVINGGAGADSLSGGNGNDTINGGAGADYIAGGNGNDTLSGEAGADRIDGGAGNDTIDGGAGGDLLVTGAGNDTVHGGAGDDFITLGVASIDESTTIGAVVGDSAGNDTVVFEATAAANGNDTISGFTVGALSTTVNGDVLDFSAFLGKEVSLNSGTPTDVTDGGVDTFVGNNVVYINDLFGATTATSTLGFDANAKIVLLQTANTNDVRISYVETGAEGIVESITTVGTLSAPTLTGGFIDANFA